MKSSKFFKGLSWLILLNLLVKPVWIFFIDREVQNIVGHEVYGQYFAVLSLSYVLFFLADAGLSTMLNQRVANKIAVNIGQLVRIKMVMLLMFVAACCFVGWLTHITQWEFLFYVIAIQALNSLFIFLRSIITANQFFAADAWFSVIDKFFMIILCGALIYSAAFGKIDLVLFLQIQTLCTGLAVLIAISFIAKKQLLTVAEKENIDKVIKLVTPFAIIILLMSVHSRLDGFLLEQMHDKGAYEAGIYASAFRLLDAGNMLGYLAASFLVPFIARHQNEKPLIESVIINTRHGLLFFAIGIVSFSLIYAPWILQLLYHSNSGYNTLVIQLCVAVLPAYYLSHIYGSVLTATSKFNLFITILVVSVVVNIILNLVLIPAYGAMGSSIAAIASQYLCAIACYIAATKSLFISFGLRSNFLYLLAAALLTGLFYFGKMTTSNVWIILAIGAFAGLLFLTTQFRTLKKYFTSLR